MIYLDPLWSGLALMFAGCLAGYALGRTHDRRQETVYANYFAMRADDERRKVKGPPFGPRSIPTSDQSTTPMPPVKPPSEREPCYICEGVGSTMGFGPGEVVKCPRCKGAGWQPKPGSESLEQRTARRREEISQALEMPPGKHIKLRSVNLSNKFLKCMVCGYDGPDDGSHVSGCPLAEWPRPCPCGDPECKEGP